MVPRSERPPLPFEEEAEAQSETGHDLAHLFRPRAVAVVGVSDDPRKLGTMAYRNLLNSGFAGEAYAVGRASAVDGRPVWDSVAALPGPVDVVFVAVPSDAAAHVVAEAADHGVKFAIVGASGFAESGNVAAQAALAASAARIGIVGPNCNGIYNTHLPLALGFNRAHAKILPAGGISIVSHSGALFDPMTRMLDALGAGIACFVSVGNEAGLEILDYAEFLAGEPDTNVVVLLADAIGCARRFAALAGKLQRAGKSCIVLKLGATERGAAAAVAHSSRMAASSDAADAVISALGVPTATTLEGLMAGAALLDRYGSRGRGTAVLTTSGAGGALIADLGARHGLEFAAFSQATRDFIEPLRTFSQLGNPFDLGVLGRLPDWERVAEAVAADPAVHLVLAYAHIAGGEASAALHAALTRAAAASGKPVIMVAPGGIDDEYRALYDASGIPVLCDTDAAIQAAAALTRPLRVPAPEALPPPLPEGLGEIRGICGERRSLELLGRLGVCVTPVRRCRSVAEAMAAAAELGWPVVVKADVGGVAHKTEQGHVRVNLHDAAAVAEAVEAMAPHPVLVQPMIRGALEAMIGVTRAEGLGPMMMAGLGGIHAEAIGDVAMWPVGAPREIVEQKLDATALGRILRSARWQHPAARDGLLAAIDAVGRLAAALGDRLEAIDVNPLILGDAGAIAVDALIVAEGEADARAG